MREEDVNIFSDFLQMATFKYIKLQGNQLYKNESKIKHIYSKRLFTWSEFFITVFKNICENIRNSAEIKYL